jgi:hypothetical protein
MDCFWQKISANSDHQVKTGGLQRRHTASQHPSNISRADEAWILSRFLSRECSLASHWTGDGLSDYAQMLVLVSTVDFTDFANCYSGPDGRLNTSLVFTTSIGGQLLVVAKETLIYIYKLEGARLRPLTSLTCPRKVLALSMDVTAGRNAVAALLEGRMGIVCELNCGQAESAESTTGAGSKDTKIGNTSGETHWQRKKKSSYANRGNIGPFLSSTFDSVDVRSNSNKDMLSHMDREHTRNRNWINQSWDLTMRGSPFAQLSNPNSRSKRGIPVDNGTSTVYRHLCSEDDPPRSVAICPQRRCVAFGCFAGIELHWIDALTGHSLSRWFPLTAPSDYLYFLPPRPEFDSAKKLRL